MKYIGFITIILLEIALSIYILSQKQGYFGDELLTFSISNSEASLLGNTSVDPYLNKELDKQIFIDFFQAKNKTFDFSTALENTHYDVHPPLYYYIIHFFSSIFSFANDGINIYAGIIPNILFFIVAQIYILLISKKIINDSIICLFPAVIYGFSVVGIDSVVVIRMYGMLTMLACIFLYFHIKAFENIEIFDTVDVSILFFAGITLIVGILTQLYFIIFAFFSCVCFFIFLILNKKYMDAIKYSFTMLLSLVLSFLLCQDIPGKIFGDNNHAYYIANELSNTSFTEKILQWYGVIDKNMYINISIILLICFCIFELSKIIVNNKKNIFTIYRISTIISIDVKLIYILIVYIATLFVVVKVTMLPRSRYIMFFDPLYIIFMIGMMDKNINCERIKKMITIATIMCIMLIYNTVNHNIMWMNYDQKIVNNIVNSDKCPEKMIIVIKKNNWWPMLNVFQISMKINKTYISIDDKIDLLRSLPNKEKSILVYIENSVDENVLEKLSNMLKIQKQTFLYNACEGKMFILNKQ